MLCFHAVILGHSMLFLHLSEVFFRFKKSLQLNEEEKTHFFLCRSE